MTDVPEPTVRVTRYEVSCLPEGHPMWIHMMLRVEYRGPDQWAVVEPFEPTPCLGSDGEWSWEPRPSERPDEWKARHRFDLDTALELAKREAAKLTVNGLIAADVLARGIKG